jgi:hypothetical protein
MNQNQFQWLAIVALALFVFIWSQKKPEVESVIPYPMFPPSASFENATSFDLPDTMYFAGELVPLHLPDVHERLDREMHINTYWHTNTIFLIKRSHRWMPRMSEILAEVGVPDDFKYLAAIESNFLNDTSGKGAVGFWQIVKTTGREFGLEITNEVDERYDPIKSTYAAAKYLKKAYGKFDNWTLVAASYNRGRSGIGRALEHQSVGNYYDLLLNEETSRYVFRILAAKEIISNPGKYGFEIDDEHLYNPEPVEYVEVSSSIKDLVSWSREQGINYKLLKRHNPWLRRDKLTVARGKIYQIAIPKVIAND